MGNIEFYTLEGSSTAEIIEKRSKFIANAYHINNKEEAENKINELKKKYYDAKHNCFAFSFVDSNDSIVEKCSDDGEPSGTAGTPILNVIKKNNLNNILIVVTRYFGGILLGTGGLTRVYSATASATVENSTIIKQEKGLEVLIEIDYSDNEKFKYYCAKNNINIIDTKYNETIFYKIEINEKEYKNMIRKNNLDNEKLTFNIKKNRVICRKFIKKEI